MHLPIGWRSHGPGSGLLIYPLACRASWLKPWVGRFSGQTAFSITPASAGPRFEASLLGFAGGKFAHRATDRLAGSSPSMKWVNPPVAYMLHAGVPRLISAGVFLPGLSQGDPAAPCADGLPRRLALEAYPGLLARELLGQRSYKSDARARQTPERLIARKDLVHGLEQGRSRLGLQLKVSHAQRDNLIDDASGDALDAVLCLMQAAWGQVQQEQGASLYGLRPELDRLEGWILSA